MRINRPKMPEDRVAFQTYTNPVYPFSFPDPYVLKFRGEYFAYSTGFATDGRVFAILRSRDLVHWEQAGSAMKPLASDPPHYWAPEVTYSGGKFYLYYSAGNETLMELRVAISDRPDGGFVDSGRRLTTEDFAIDAHIFMDTDGARYMFYATDFLEHTHIGTGIVVDRMLDWFKLEGKPRPVTRAKYDWQVYDPARIEKGGVRWHTVEGPFVLKRKGLYYEMFSGGNWQNISYGVSFAATNDIDLDEEWEQNCDGENVLPVLRTLPGRVIGPGHNSVVRGPNSRELYCVYHRWVGDARVLAIDRMDFAGRRIFINGATDTPQPAPYKPSIAGFEGISIGKKGNWCISSDAAKSLEAGNHELIFGEHEPFYLAEIDIENREENGRSYGFYLADDADKIFELRIFEDYVEEWIFKQERLESKVSKGVESEGVSHLRIEVNGLCVAVWLNGSALVQRSLERIPSTLAFTADAPDVQFSGLVITRGFEDLFEIPDSHGWDVLRGDTPAEVSGGEMLITASEAAAVTKGPEYDCFEFVVNIRLAETFSDRCTYGFEIVSRNSTVLRLQILENHLWVGDDVFALPEAFLETEFRQFRLVKTGAELSVHMEDTDIVRIPAPWAEARVAVFCESASVALEMVRLTDLTNSLTSPE